MALTKPARLAHTAIMRIFIFVLAGSLPLAAHCATLSTNSPGAAATLRPVTSAVVTAALNRIDGLDPVNPLRDEATSLIERWQPEQGQLPTSQRQRRAAVQSVIRQLRFDASSEGSAAPEADQSLSELESASVRFERLQRLGGIFLNPAENAQIAARSQRIAVELAKKRNSAALAEEKRLENWFSSQIPNQLVVGENPGDLEIDASPTPARIALLRQAFAGKDLRFTEVGFNAFVVSDPNATSRVLGHHIKN